MIPSTSEFRLYIMLSLVARRIISLTLTALDCTFSIRLVSWTRSTAYVRSASTSVWTDTISRKSLNAIVWRILIVSRTFSWPW